MAYSRALNRNLNTFFPIVAFNHNPPRSLPVTYQMLLWDDVAELIKQDRLSELVRSKEQDLKYEEFKQKFIASHGSTAGYLINERLKWSGDKLTPSGAPFLQNLSDIKILKNDFSYDFEPNVRHLCVWSKTPIPGDANGHTNPEADQAIEQYVHQKFVVEFNIDRSRLLWFKNPTALQTIPAVPHFHVLVRDCTDEMVREIEQSSVNS